MVADPTEWTFAGPARSGQEPRQFRPLLEVPVPALGELFLDAYRDTVDYEGESLEDAIGEVQNVIGGGYGQLAQRYSLTLGQGGEVHSALFVTETPEGDLFIPYVVTAKSHGRQGLAKALLERCLQQAKDHGVSSVDLYVTEANRGAVELYQSLGFRVVTSGS
jgi:ribosomal protein S18 acetylase RimI-like enzyme